MRFGHSKYRLWLAQVILGKVLELSLKSILTLHSSFVSIWLDLGAKYFTGALLVGKIRTMNWQFLKCLRRKTKNKLNMSKQH